MDKWFIAPEIIADNYIEINGLFFYEPPMQASSSSSTVDLSRKWEGGNTVGDGLGKQDVI